VKREKVWVSNKIPSKVRQSSKFHSKYIEPVTIIKKNSPNNYIIADNNGTKKTIHVSHLY
jgi:hypothetical protein